MQPVSRKPTGHWARRDENRWLGGVCSGVADARAIDVAWIRLAFVAAAGCAGVGFVVYAACWLILPGPDDARDRERPSWLVVGALGSAACVAFLLIALIAASLTVFGFGWIALVLAGAVLVAFLTLPGIGPARALVVIAALTLPSVAAAADGLRLSATLGALRVAPQALSAGSRLTVTAGLGTTLIDLRDTRLPTSGTVTLRVYGGPRRTIIALPHDRCLPVTLDDHTAPFLTQAAAQLVGREPVAGEDLFGGDGLPAPQAVPGGLTLHIDFTSLGGSLYVRDYPVGVDPDAQPAWPGYRVFVEPRPNTHGLRKRTAKMEIAAWRARRSVELRSQRKVLTLLPGPCGKKTSS
jgi:phage shock protein PspC (stress-responsive transcriptional regulator)